jgi:ribosomal protein L12E/L44/L45/RPP1/RPP2
VLENGITVAAAAAAAARVRLLGASPQEAGKEDKREEMEKEVNRYQHDHRYQKYISKLFML